MNVKPELPPKRQSRREKIKSAIKYAISLLSVILGVEFNQLEIGIIVSLLMSVLATLDIVRAKTIDRKIENNNQGYG